jgi:hypothetical protein
MSDDEQRIGLNVEVPPVRLGSVTSLDDRRKIQSLERQVANLTEKLALAGDRVKPTLAKSHSSCARHDIAIGEFHPARMARELGFLRRKAA